MSRVLLLGATGLIGSQVLPRLLEDPRCSGVVAPVRRPLAVVHARLQAPVIDFEALPGQADWWGVEAVICALGTTRAVVGSAQAFRHVDYDYPMACARIAHAAGAQAFVLNSAAGANPQSRIFYSRVKGELERDLRALGFASLTLVRPGLIGGQRTPPRPAEQLGQQVLGVLGPLLPRSWRISPAGHIAAALCEAALAPRPGVQVVSAAQLA